MSEIIEEKEVKKKKPSDKVAMIAKKDHTIFQNGYKLIITKGDDLSKKEIPERFLPTLKTEKII